MNNLKVGQRWKFKSKSYEYIVEVVCLPNKVKVLQNLKYSVYKVGDKYYSMALNQIWLGEHPYAGNTMVYLPGQDNVNPS